MNDDQKTGNQELVEQEIESLKSILNDQECAILSKDEYLSINDRDHADKVQSIVKLSLIPNSQKKFIIIDGAKDIQIELRCLPALELVIIVPTYYPSSGKPLLIMETKFYDSFKDHLYEKLNEKWSDDMLVLYEFVCFIQDEFLNSFFENADTSKLKFSSSGNIEIKYNSSMDFQKVFDSSVQAQRRSFNNEESLCKICERNLLGDKFFFLSGCEHYFCLECIKQMATLKINSMQINQLCCPESTCKKNLNDLDIRNMGLDNQLFDKYEQFSLTNAIAQMDDLGWCPLPGCGSLADIVKDGNYGKCQHCEYMFCLDCRERYHPYKRCLINRLDLVDLANNPEYEELGQRNKLAEAALNALFFKYCAKYCPNLKCGIRIQKIKSGCTKMQCPKCFHHFCWVCLNDAKGMKHFKERPDCNIEEDNLQPEELSNDIKAKNLSEYEQYVNLKFCAKCPHCNEINEKKTRSNALTCTRCTKMFCYICNKAITGLEHYEGKSLCHTESDLYADF